MLALAAPALAKPQRVVSLNLCADELALRLAHPDVVKSVTWLAQDRRNASADVADMADALPPNDGHAEEALGYRPDLVLVGPYADPAAGALLERVGAPVVDVSQPHTLDGAWREIRRVAAALGEPQRGEAMIAAIEARLSRVAVDPRSPRLEALVLHPAASPSGAVRWSMRFSTRAGLDNLAARRLDLAADAGSAARPAALPAPMR